MEGTGMFEGYSHMANIFLTGCVVGLQAKIWDILEETYDCDGGVTRLASGDLAVRVLGNRAQKLQEVAEKIKGLF